MITEQLDPEDESDATAKVQVNILCERHGPDNSTIGEQQVLAPPKENEAVKVASSLGLQGPAAPIGAQLLASGGPEDHASATVYHANLVAGTSSTIALQQPLLTSLNPAAALAGMQASAEANSLDFQAMQSMEWIFKKERMYLLTQFWQQVRVTTQSPKLQNFDIFVCFCFFFFKCERTFRWSRILQTLQNYFVNACVRNLNYFAELCREYPQVCKYYINPIHLSVAKNVQSYYLQKLVETVKASNEFEKRHRWNIDARVNFAKK